MTAPRPTGSIDIWNFVDNVTGTTVRKWLRDSWARKKIVALQQAVAAIVVPTRTSQLTNDSGYITQADVPPGSTPSSTTPLMDGTAAVGTETAFARGDHRHPTDTSRQAALSTAQMAAVNSGVTAAKVQAWDGITVPTKTSELTNDSGYITAAALPTETSDLVNDSGFITAADIPAIPSKTSDLTNDSGYITASAIPSVPSASTASPKMDGTASAGSSTTWSRGDHVHPHDTSKADKATTLSGYGITNAYTKTEVDNLIPAVPSAYTSSPSMDGTASAGSSTAWSRGDHVHPHDSSKQDALTSAQLAAVNSGITADDLAVNDASVLCTVTPIEPTLLEPCYHSTTYGRCWYYKIGHHVHVHVGISGLTSGTTADVFYLPEGYRPYSLISNVGTGASMSNYSRLRVATDGRVFVNANAASACVDIEFDAFQ